MRLATVRGVPILVSPLALLFAVLVATTWAQYDRNRLPELADGAIWTVAAVTAAGFLASLVLHEIGHCLTALRFGLGVQAITVYGFAGFTEISPEPQTPGREFAVAAAGPAVNGVLAAAFWAAHLAVARDTAVGVLMLDLAVTNALLFVFNLAPGLPLDGGRVVLSGVWRLTGDKLLATRGAAYAGFLVAAAVGLWGLSLLRAGSGGLWTLLVAGFIGLGAASSLRSVRVRSRLPGLSAGGLARPAIFVPVGTPLAEALRRARAAGRLAVVVVDRDGGPAAVMSGAAADATPEQRRPWISVEEVSRPISAAVVLPADLAGEDLLRTLQQHPAPEYVVRGRPGADGAGAGDGDVVGVLAAVDLAARLDPRGRAAASP
jgi:Zn-dependent protease/CBS domain-containing protein